jgi:hypothetical protein
MSIQDDINKLKKDQRNEEKAKVDAKIAEQTRLCAEVDFFGSEVSAMLKKEFKGTEFKLKKIDDNDWMILNKNLEILRVQVYRSNGTFDGSDECTDIPYTCPGVRCYPPNNWKEVIDIDKLMKNTEEALTLFKERLVKYLAKFDLT